MKEESKELGKLLVDYANKADNVRFDAIKFTCPGPQRIDMFVHALEVCAENKQQTALNFIADSLIPTEVVPIHTKVSENLALKVILNL